MIHGTPDTKSLYFIMKGETTMAINPYSYGFNGYGMQPMFVQPMYPQQPIEQYQPQYSQQPTVNTQPQQTNTDSYFIWVQGEAGAKSYPVARGATLPLFDTEGDYVYFKTVDNNGVPLPLITKVLSDPQSKVETKENTIETKEIVEIDTSGFVTKETYDDLKKKYEDLEIRIMELETKPSSNFTSNFTGNTFNNSRKGNVEDGSKFTL